MMKYLRWMQVFVVTCLAQVSIAQTFTTSSSQSGDTLSFAAPGYHEFHNTITNTSNDTIWITWHLVPSQSYVPSGWTVTAWDNNVAYPFNSVSHTSNYIRAGYSADFAIAFDPNGLTQGSNSYIAQVLTDNASGTTKAIKYSFTKTPTGVNTIQQQADDEIEMYPNPAPNDINVVFNESLGVKSIAIYNLIGKSMLLYKTQGNSAKLNIESLPAGIYFLRFMNPQGMVVATRKFTHQ
jgi:hypothetical protein